MTPAERRVVAAAIAWRDCRADDPWEVNADLIAAVDELVKLRPAADEAPWWWCGLCSQSDSRVYSTAGCSDCATILKDGPEVAPTEDPQPPEACPNGCGFGLHDVGHCDRGEDTAPQPAPVVVIENRQRGATSRGPHPDPRRRICLYCGRDDCEHLKRQRETEEAWPSHDR